MLAPGDSQLLIFPPTGTRISSGVEACIPLGRCTSVPWGVDHVTSGEDDTLP